MSAKEDILSRCRRNAGPDIKPPSLKGLDPLTFADPLEKFKSTSVEMSCRVIDVPEGKSLNDAVREAFPDAKTICTNIPGIDCATSNPDTVASVTELNHTDVGVVPGMLGVAENGCIWVPQTMKEKAVCFISENLAIVLPRENVVSNMHEAYRRIEFNDYGYGVFISGPSKTADIAQVLVTGAQAARTLTVFLI